MKRFEQVTRWTNAAMLLLAAFFLCLHYVHLSADFPNHSPWMDWAKYTDEGWYGDAAIRYYLRGTWRLPGDFNPAAALPVWPVLEGLLFRFTGVGIVAARALAVTVFACTLAAAWLLLNAPDHEPVPPRAPPALFASAGLLLLASSPYIYTFSRMAILEPLLILLTMCALLLGRMAGQAILPARRYFLSAVLGLDFALMLGTKTTALFLLPAVLYFLWDQSGWRWTRLWRETLVFGLTAGVCAGGYLLFLVHRGYLEDFRYLFAANQYTNISRALFTQELVEAMRDGMWTGQLVFPIAIAAICLTLVRPRIWKDGLFTSFVLWAAGYFAFLVYHANLQPRYYLVIAVPLTLAMVRACWHFASWHRVAYGLMLPLLLLVVGLNSRQLLHYVRHPEYSFVSAAAQIEKIVESAPNHSHTVLSISGSDLTLMTGLPSICDDFGTMDLEDRIAAYRPGWFVAWNYVEDDKMDALAKYYRLTRVAEIPAYDDPDRNLMIVYRLDRRPEPAPSHRRRDRQRHGSGAAQSDSAS